MVFIGKEPPSLPCVLQDRPDTKYHSLWGLASLWFVKLWLCCPGQGRGTSCSIAFVFCPTP